MWKFEVNGSTNDWCSLEVDEKVSWINCLKLWKKKVYENYQSQLIDCWIDVHDDTDFIAKW